MVKTEIREISTNGIEYREDTENGSKKLAGYVVKWEKKSFPMGFFRRFKEQFKRGAFTESLQKDDQRALWSHDTAKVLGRIKNGTLLLREEAEGLYFELELPNTTLGHDAFESVKRGDVDGLSFGFRMITEEWDDKDQADIIRTITKASLIEISLIAFPAYPDSEVSTRSNDPYKDYKQSESQRRKLLLRTYL